jgi:hypothetical protein
VNVKNLTGGTMPDITPPQIVALVIAGIPILATLLRAFGVFDLSLAEQQALSDTLTWAGVFAGTLIGGDAILRTGRNVRKGKVEAALASGDDVNTDSAVVDGSVLAQLPLDGGMGPIPTPSSARTTPTVVPGTTGSPVPGTVTTDPGTPPDINPATGLPNKPRRPDPSKPDSGFGA